MVFSLIYNECVVLCFEYNILMVLVWKIVSILVSQVCGPVSMSRLSDILVTFS